MSIATVLPFVPAQWFTSAGDAVLSGGQLWFYDVGTTTPKSVFADYEMTAALPNPVILNAAGKASIFLGAGGYKVVLCDALGAVMDTVDGVFADPTTVGGGTVQTGVATFADLREFTNPGAVVTVLVAGALVQGDGGGGLFTFDPTISTTDDGGIYIAPNFGLGRWVRSVSGIPSISWWGIKGVTTESDDGAIANAFAYCSANNYSLIIDKPNVGLRVNRSFSGSKMIFSGGFFYTSSATPTLGFSGGATIQADPHDLVISGNGAILYGEGQIFSPEWTSPALTDTGLQIAINSAGAHNCTMVIAARYECSGSVISPANVAVDFTEDGMLAYSVGASLAIENVVYTGVKQVAEWPSVVAVGAIHFGAGSVRPEWFGAVGDGVADDSAAIQAAARHGEMTGAKSANYKAVDAVSCASVTFRSEEARGSADRPIFDFAGGLVISSGQTLSAISSVVQVNNGTFRDLVGDSSRIVISGVALNGAISLDESEFAAVGACSTDSVYTVRAVNSVFAGGEYLPVMAWELTGGAVTLSDRFSISKASGARIECPIVLAPPVGTRAALIGCDVLNSTYSPTLTGGAYADATGCRFLSTAGSPAEHSSWSNGIIWRFPMSDSTTVVTYSGCTQNGLPVWDPHAAAIDSVPVEYVRGSVAPIPFASWHGLPSGVSASGNALLTGSTLDVTEPMEDGSGWTASGWHGLHSSFANDFGFALVSVSLVASSPAAFVDLVLATSPVYVNRADYPSASWPPASRLIRDVTPKVGVRIMAGRTILVPVWIGAGDTVAAGTGSVGSGQVTARSTVTKLQAQIIRWSVPTGTTVSVSIREGVATEKSIFDALYNAPDISQVAAGASFEETGYPRCIDAVSYLGTDRYPDGSAKIRLRGNDLRYSAGAYANSGRFFTWAPISSSQLETIIGASYSRSPFTNVAPVSPGALVYRTGNPNGAMLSFDVDASTGFAGYRIISASNVVD